MRFKFGDTVRIVENPFYEDMTGYVVNFERHADSEGREYITYEVVMSLSAMRLSERRVFLEELLESVK